MLPVWWIFFSMYGCNLCWVVIAQMRKDAYGWNLNSDDLSPRKRKCVISSARLKIIETSGFSFVTGPCRPTCCDCEPMRFVDVDAFSSKA